MTVKSTKMEGLLDQFIAGVPAAALGFGGAVLAMLGATEIWVQLLIVIIPSMFGVIGSLASIYLKYRLETSGAKKKELKNENNALDND